MKDQDTKKYIKLGITGVSVIVVSLLFFFVLFRLRELFGIVKLIMDIVAPFLYGAVFAYILAPLCNRFELLFAKLFRKPTKSTLCSVLSITLTLFLAVAVISVLIVLVIPQVWDSIVNIANAFPGYLKTANEWLHAKFEDEPAIQEYWDDLYVTAVSRVTEWLKSDLFSTVGAIIDGISTHVFAFFAALKNFFLGLLISAYFLGSRKKFALQSKMILYSLLPEKAASMIEEEVRYIDRMFNGFLVGKLLDSLIIGLLCFIGTSILRFRSALLISVIVGVTNIIPFFGPFIGAIPCALLLLFQNPLHCLYFLIFIVVLQQLDGNFIGPKILGNTTGLSSFWVLFSILLFGGLWGIFGMIVGVPLFAVVYDIVRRMTVHGLQKHGKTELIEEYDAKFHKPEKPPREAKPRIKLSFKKNKKTPASGENNNSTED